MCVVHTAAGKSRLRGPGVTPWGLTGPRALLPCPSCPPEGPGAPDSLDQLCDGVPDLGGAWGSQPQDEDRRRLVCVCGTCTGDSEGPRVYMGMPQPYR